MADDSKRPELLRLSDGSIGRFGLDCLIVASKIQRFLGPFEPPARLLTVSAREKEADDM